MPFISRVTETPTIPTIQELEQIIIVDKTGPAMRFGVSSGLTCLVGEFLKGPFIPTEIFSQGDLTGLYGAVSSTLSQTAPNGAQNRGNLFYNGNGAAELKGKSFKRLCIQRVDTDMQKTGSPGVKAFLKFTIAANAADYDAVTLLTNKDMLIPAGTLFTDDVTIPTEILALSQDILIPQGTAVTAGTFLIVCTATSFTQSSSTGSLTYVATGGTIGATAFFVLGFAAAIAFVDSIFVATIPGCLSTIGVISTVDSSAAPCAVEPMLFTADLQDSITACYAPAINKTLPGATDLGNDITVIWSARNDKAYATYTIRDLLKTNAVTAASSGRGRIACISNAMPATALYADSLTAKTAVKAMQANYTGVDADRVTINFPYVKVYSSELGKNIDVSPAGFKAALFSTLPEEWESGVANDVMQSIKSYDDCFLANGLVRADFVSFKTKGVSAIRYDRQVGWEFQSALTAANATTYPTRTKDNRRRMADFIQDMLASLAGLYNKKPGTTERVDALLGEMHSFLSSLLSVGIPSMQRIEAYAIDAISANSAALTAVGIRTIIVQVQMLGDLDYIVFQTEIGPTVEITQTA
jgi:hypothetical protein